MDFHTCLKELHLRVLSRNIVNNQWTYYSSTHEIRIWLTPPYLLRSWSYNDNESIAYALCSPHPPQALFNEALLLPLYENI
jgi:hypothetical protein